MTEVQLRAVEVADLEHFFRFESEPEASRRARFPSRERAAFMTHWETRILGDPTVVSRTVLADGDVAGNLGAWQQDGQWQVGYWLGQRFWGRGVGTRALLLFVAEVTARPLYADAAVTNTGSIRLLEKCGFTRAEDVEEGYATYVLTA
ncbi:GNAT family N-acetyltransferase [Longispora sp. NPDC051575]|uniref:GNAT family N-acetyltransferase n=1 Tax=Longispora sp. NPDC051575 TaxID=3154943 RepID=UPI00343B4354